MDAGNLITGPHRDRIGTEVEPANNAGHQGITAMATQIMGTRIRPRFRKTHQANSY